jgi:hypothetical protein
MSDYSDYRVSQARSERARERAAQQRRVALTACGVLLAVFAVFAFASSLRGAPAAPPRVVLTWPSPQKYGKRTLDGAPDASGVALLGEFLLRPREPFSIALQNAPDWHASFAGATPTGDGARWQPAKDGETLKIFVRPKTGGWRKLFAWAQPKMELRLTARAARTLDANRRALQLKDDGITARSVWLSQNVAASSVASKGTTILIWDQRAIPLLEAISRAVPYSGPQPGPGRSMPLPPPRAPRWSVVPGFDGKATPNDKGSYFQLNAADALSDEVAIVMTRLARQLAARAPKTGIKWIVKNVGSSDTTATLRLEFDGSGARGGWVKNFGERDATPLRWWNKRLGIDEIRERIEPSVPRR